MVTISETPRAEIGPPKTGVAGYGRSSVAALNFDGPLPIVILGVLALLTYANSFHAGMVLDNNLILLRDPRLRVWSRDSLVRIFTENYWWPTFPSDLYRPLTTLSYLLNYSVLGNGAAPLGYHWINFILHLTAVRNAG